MQFLEKGNEHCHKQWRKHISCISGAEQESDKIVGPTCCTYSSTLNAWMKENKVTMRFAVPTVWREPTNHAIDCYFCLVSPLSKGFNKKKKRAIQYPNIPTAMRPIPHGEGLPVPDPSVATTTSSDYDSEDQSDTCHPFTSNDPTFSTTSTNEMHRITQSELSDLIRDLELPKSKVELLASRLKNWNLLANTVRVSTFR